MPSKITSYLNRAVVVLTMLAGLAAAIAVPAANLDLSSTIGTVSGLGAIVAASLKFLSGWQAHEARVAAPMEYTSVQTGALEGALDSDNPAVAKTAGPLA